MEKTKTLMFWVFLVREIITEQILAKRDPGAFVAQAGVERQNNERGVRDGCLDRDWDN